MVETKDLPGYRVGRVLDKMGLHGQDTAELFFDGVQVPADCLLGGEEGQGIHQLMDDLPYERTLHRGRRGGAMEGGSTHRWTMRGSARPSASRCSSYRTRASSSPRFETRVQSRACSSTLHRGSRGGRARHRDASMAKWWLTDMQQQVPTNACSSSAATAT